MITKCTTCIHRYDFDHDCKQHKQTTDEWKGLLIVLTCTGYQAKDTVPVPVDKTPTPATIDR